MDGGEIDVCSVLRKKIEYYQKKKRDENEMSEKIIKECVHWAARIEALHGLGRCSSISPVESREEESSSRVAEGPRRIGGPREEKVWGSGGKVKRRPLISSSHRMMVCEEEAGFSKRLPFRDDFAVGRKGEAVRNIHSMLSHYDT